MTCGPHCVPGPLCCICWISFCECGLVHWIWLWISLVDSGYLIDLVSCMMNVLNVLDLVDIVAFLLI